MLRKHLMRILSLSNEKMCSEEARKKFNCTFMIVNGSVAEVKEVNWTDKTLIICQGGSTREVKIKDLEPWLPDSGLYRLSSGQAAAVYKRPKRQWLKSFSLDYYTVICVGDGQDGHQYQSTSEFYNDIVNAKRVDIFVDSCKDIFYHKTRVGYIKDQNTIVCTDNRFIQELKDWSRDT